MNNPTKKELRDWLVRFINTGQPSKVGRIELKQGNYIEGFKNFKLLLDRADSFSYQYGGFTPWEQIEAIYNQFKGE